VLHPDHDEAVLWQPGSCLVVRATAPGKLSSTLRQFKKTVQPLPQSEIEP